MLGAQEVYSEATLPAPLQLRPGLTTVTGGATDAGGSDVFYFAPTADGTVTVRLRYTHRAANFLQGITEHAHLAANVTPGDFRPPDSFFGFSPAVALGSTFLLNNGQNTLTAAPLAFDAVDSGAVRVVVSAPSGKVNPAYTLEVEYQPARDAWDSGGGNDSAAAAVPRGADLPAQVGGTLHSATDQDWFRFEVPEGRTLFLYAFQSSPGPPPYRLRTELLSGAGVVLQSATGQTGVFAETAGPGGRTYFLKLSSADGRAAAWVLEWRLEDHLEPNETEATARGLGTLTATSRLEVRGLTRGVLDRDHFSFVTNLPVGTRILVAAPDDPLPPSGGGASLLLSSVEAEVLEEGRGFAVISAPPGTTVVFRLLGAPARYRLLIKLESAYDRWHQAATGAQQGPAAYIPPDADLDGDGLPAALEWALQGSLFARDPWPVSAPAFDGSEWRVTISLPNGGLVAPVRLRESTDLLTWTDVPALRTNLGGSSIPPGRRTPAVVTLTRPGAPRNWVRLEVEE